jgi:hypothetical protein
MAAGKKGGGPEKPLQEDRILARLVGDSTQVTTGVTSYTGLLGRSPKEGYWLLYLTLDMTLSVEVREEDIVHSDQLSPDKSPFGSLGGTQVFIKKDAMVTTTRTASLTHQAGAKGDEFDLDIKLGGGGGGVPVWCHATATTCIVCPGDGGGPGGPGEPEGPGTESCFKTCHNCRTEGTCRTDCNQATCQTCKQTQCGTCQTCQTCQTKCGQATCKTCATYCGQATCHTCGGDDTCGGTCGACHTKDATCFQGCDF